QSSRSETDVATLALELAREAPQDRRAHIGYYLIGEGVRALEKRAGSRTPIRDLVRRVVYRWPSVLYLGGSTLFTLALLAAIPYLVTPAPWWMLLALALPASQAAISVM